MWLPLISRNLENVGKYMVCEELLVLFCPVEERPVFGEFESVIHLETKGSRLSASLPHCHCLLVGVGACLGIPKSSGNLAVLGQVEGGDLLGLLDLLLVGLHLVLISSEGQLLDCPLGL